MRNLGRFVLLRLLIAAFLLATIGRARASSGDEFTAKVVGISDGDTITVLRDKTPIRIRLHGIDCPETGQDFGSRAKAFTSDLAFDKVVTVQPRDTDRYGRTVAVVVLADGRILNHELTKAGLAWWYRTYAPRDERLAALEIEARTAKLGLWSDPNPIPPWEWRSGKVRIAGVAPGLLTGNRRSHLYHAATCRNAGKIAVKNRISFDTRAKAEAAGYRHAGDCK